MRKPLVAGNWKMNGTTASARTLVEGIVAGMDRVQAAEVAVCPPYVYLPLVRDLLAGSPVALGSQDVAKEDPGAYTGEVAAPMLVDVGCTYAIVGHSERRSYYGDTDDVVAAKVERALREGLKPIVCVGELLEEREADRTEEVVGRQLDAVLERVGPEGLGQGVIAYEPVWAIGTGRTATPEQAQDVHAFIRGRLAARDAGVAEAIRILYGGSVKADNAAGLFAKADIDGGLIGGASLKVEDFLGICSAAG
jgi:triosephosphate isomerase